MNEVSLCKKTSAFIHAPAVLELPALWWLVVGKDFLQTWLGMKRSVVSEAWLACASTKVGFAEFSYSLAQLDKDGSGHLRRTGQPWLWRPAGLGRCRVPGSGHRIWAFRLGHLGSSLVLSFPILEFQKLLSKRILRRWLPNRDALYSLIVILSFSFL